MKPKISVIIPVFNTEKYLEECLTSIQTQTLKELEIICFDNHSTDQSLRLLKKYQKQDTRIQIIESSKNLGPGPARNQAIKKANGEFLAFCDADDWYPNPNSLQKMYDAAKKHHVSIICGSFSEYNTLNKQLNTDWSHHPHLADYKIKRNGLKQYKDWQSDIGWIRCLYRRDFILKNKIEFPNLSRHEDPVFFVDAMITAQQFYAISDIVYCYRIFHKPMQLTQKNIEDAFTGIAYNLAIAKTHNLKILEKWCIETLLWYATLTPEVENLKQSLSVANQKLNEQQQKIDQLESNIHQIKTSKAYKIGLKITAPYHLLQKKH